MGNEFEEVRRGRTEALRRVLRADCVGLWHQPRARVGDEIAWESDNQCDIANDTARSELAGSVQPCSAPMTASSPRRVSSLVLQRLAPTEATSCSLVWPAWWLVRCRWRPASTSR